MAVRTTRIEDNGGGTKTDLIIPAKALSEVARIIGDETKSRHFSARSAGSRRVPVREHADRHPGDRRQNTPDFTAIIPKSLQHGPSRSIPPTCSRAPASAPRSSARDSNYSARILVRPATESSTLAKSRSWAAARSAATMKVPDASIEGNSSKSPSTSASLIDVPSVTTDEQVVLESKMAPPTPA
ncbi:MAG: hypothetical protein IPK19_18680 [Chloroflexi bacterium]|nr:hypothetical protein [Chloroflexota bacterium]